MMKLETLIKNADGNNDVLKTLLKHYDKEAFNDAFAKFQAKIHMPKQSEGHHVNFRTKKGMKVNYYYTDLGQIISRVIKAMTGTGLSFHWDSNCKSVRVPVGNNGSFRLGEAIMVSTILSYGSYDVKLGHVNVIISDTDPQNVGSAMSYARRYSLSTAVGLSTIVDDDFQKGERSNSGSFGNTSSWGNNRGWNNNSRSNNNSSWGKPRTNSWGSNNNRGFNNSNDSGFSSGKSKQTVADDFSNNANGSAKKGGSSNFKSKKSSPEPDFDKTFKTTGSSANNKVKNLRLRVNMYEATVAKKYNSTKTTIAGHINKKLNVKGTGKMTYAQTRRAIGLLTDALKKKKSA